MENILKCLLFIVNILLYETFIKNPGIEQLKKINSFFKRQMLKSMYLRFFYVCFNRY